MPTSPPQSQPQPPQSPPTASTGHTSKIIFGSFSVKVFSSVPGVIPTAKPSDFTVNIELTSGTATPSSFPGSELGTDVTFTGGEEYR